MTPVRLALAATAAAAALLVPSAAHAAPGVLEYGTMLGGTWGQNGEAIAVDAQGNAYVTGQTSSPDMPMTPGAFQPLRSDLNETYVAKVNADGSLGYATYLGGDTNDGNRDYGFAIAVDGAGNAYVAGSAVSPDFPTTAGAYDRAVTGAGDAFVTKIGPTGNLVYSTVIGRENSAEQAFDIAVGPDGSAYVAGSTNAPFGSPDFPTTPGADDVTPDGEDGFVAKLDPTGSTLVWSTVLGGDRRDLALSVAVDGQGRVLVGGMADSGAGVTTPGAYQTDLRGGEDGVVAAYAGATGEQLWATYLGGDQGDVVDALSVDAAGEVYVAGRATSSDFPAPGGTVAQVFAARFAADGSALRWITRPVPDTSWPKDLAADGAGGVWLVGLAPASGLAVTPNGLPRRGDTDGYAARLSAADGSTGFVTAIGATYGFEDASGVAAMADGRAWVTGAGGSSDFPVTANAIQPKHIATSGMGYAVRLDPFAATFLAPAGGGAGPGGTGGGSTGPDGTGGTGGSGTGTTPGGTTAPPRLARARLKGRTLRFTLDRRATVKAVLTGRVPGRRKGSRCVAGRRTGAACKATVRRTATYAGRSGANRVEVRTKGLRPGRYALKLTARDAATGTRSRAVQLELRVR